MTSTDLSLLASAGVAEVEVFSRLRVGVLSTGDELRKPGQPADDWQIYDANRLMLLSMIRDLGFEAVDLGLVEDVRDTVRNTLNEGANLCDLIITSGGASAGDEDHILISFGVMILVINPWSSRLNASALNPSATRAI